MKKKDIFLFILLIVCLYLLFNNNYLENFYVSTGSSSNEESTESKLATSQIEAYEKCCANEISLNKQVERLNKKISKLEGENETLRNPPKEDK